MFVFKWLDKMKILFLDIDGVLNTHESLIQNIEFDTACLNQLERIIQTTGCKIVISSAWRMFGKQYIIDTINQAAGYVGNITQAIIDMTPDRACNGDLRGDEIQAWLNQNTDLVSQFVIVDDDTDMGNLLPYLVKTNPQSGLTVKLANKIIKRLS